MRVAVYDRFWPSMGGGERHAGMVAQVISHSGHDVDLIGHTPVSLEGLGRHLALDLSHASLRVLPDRGDEAMSDHTAEYDLFINASYMSRVASRAPRSAYLCYFPTPINHDLTAFQRAALHRFGPYVEKGGGGELPTGMAYGPGWFPPEGGRRRQWTWTSGSATLAFGPGPTLMLSAEFGRPGAPGPATLTVKHGSDAQTFDVGADFAPHDVVVEASTDERTVLLHSDTFTPGPADQRQLGVAVSRLRIQGSRRTAQQRLAARHPWLLRNPDDFRYLSTYDLILANSDYTRQWIDTLWHRPAEILYPPIEVGAVEPAQQRDHTILSVGRFIQPGHGHCKRQLELVEMFGELHASGQLPGWGLVLIGGCEETQAPYLEAVTAAARGLPVEVHANAPRATVEHHMSTASIFWAATGLGENTEKRPWTNEHFGMTTAEAMAGGCVPIVIDRAGQREIVREGVDGFRWSDAAQLRIRTVQVATDEKLRARLAAASRIRVQQFSDPAFAARLNDLLSTHRLTAI